MSSNKGKIYLVSEEVRKKMSLAHLGIKTIPCSDEKKLKISLANKGKKRSLEMRKRQSKRQKGISPSEESNRKRSETLKGRMPKFIPKRKGMKASKELREKLSKAQYNSPNRWFKETSIELATKRELDLRGIVYKQNYPLLGIANVDFFLPELNTVIECDGCFWHGCPEHNPKWTKRKEKDASKTQKLREAGFRVFRFWEHEIKNSIFDCVDKVLMV